MPELIIRPYHPKDKSAVVELIRQNTPDFFSPDEEKEFVHYLDHAIEKYFVLTLEDKIAGCGGINYENNYTTGIISWDMIDPRYQGQHLGSQLLLHRLQLLYEDQLIKRIIVRTSQLTCKFYEKMGFQLKEVREDYWAPGYHLYYMEYSK